MILKTLTQEQTSVWISNLNKVIAIREAVKKYNNDDFDKMDKLFKESYGKLYKFFYNAQSLQDLHISWDGYYHVPNSFLFGRVKKLGKVPTKLYMYKAQLRSIYSAGRQKTLTDTKIKWERYAEQPFQITDEDFEFYMNLSIWHKELKDVLIEGGVYDEALDLDEDC